MSDLNESAKARAAETYNSAADHFDDNALGFWNRFGTSTIERLKLPGGAKVLDVACGTGASALPAARAVGDNGHVTAADLAENLLKLGREKAAGSGLKNIEFIKGDMTSLGYPDEHFDAVICVFGIFFVPDMESLLKELWRMVKPGGKLAVTTWGPRIFAPVYDVWREAVKKERPDLYSAFNPWDKITEVRAVEDLFLSAGISNTEVVAENGFQELSKAEDWWAIVLGSGLRWTVDEMGAEAASKVRRQNIEWLLRKGITSVETNVIYAVATK